MAASTTHAYTHTHTAHVNCFLSIGTGGLVLNHTHLPNPASKASAVCVLSCTQVETSKHIRHTLTATDTEQVGTICILSRFIYSPETGITADL